MDVQFIASIAVITPQPQASRDLYVEALGLPLDSADGDYLHSEEVAGSRHFGIWPLSDAARACFGRDDWPAGRPVPQASVEFEVAGASAVAGAAEELAAAGFELLHGAREEPWGQTVARLQTVEGAVDALGGLGGRLALDVEQQPPVFGSAPARERRPPHRDRLRRVAGHSTASRSSPSRRESAPGAADAAPGRLSGRNVHRPPIWGSMHVSSDGPPLSGRSRAGSECLARAGGVVRDS